MVFEIDKTDIATSVRYQKSNIFKTAKIFLPLAIFLLLLVLALAIILKNNSMALVGTLLMLVIPPLVYFRLAFINGKPSKLLGDCLNDQNLNLALAANTSAISVVIVGEGYAKKNNSVMSPFWLMYGFLEDNESRELFIRMGIFINANNLESVKNNIRLDSSAMERLLASSAEFASSSGGTYLEVEDLIVGLVKTDEFFKSLIKMADIDEKAVIDVALWHKRVRKERVKVPFWEEPVIGGVGQDWAYGYTQMLQQYGLNLTKTAGYSGVHVELFSRSSYVEEMERLLAKSEKNNVLLVGDYGVGKKTMIMALAQKISGGAVHPALRYKQIMQINVGALLAGSQTQGDIVGRVQMLLNEAARAGNMILFFDDFHAMVSSEQSVGSVNAAEIILPYLQGSALQVIGSTTIERYHKDIETATGIIELFEKIDVPEPSAEEALKMLEESVPLLEGRYGVIFIYQALHEIVKLSERYIHDKPFPQKALDLASEVAVKVSATKNRIVTNKDVEDTVSARTHVPLGAVQSSEKDRLLNLENILHNRIVGQNEAVEAVANAMRRSRSGLSDKHRPIGTFLFVGPTGVGKTEMAKALAEAYFGDEEKMIRFDMSEYQDAASIYNLIGSPAGPGAEGQPGLMTSAVHDNPFSLLLLDELEKAHPNLLTLFLQVFDDGRLTGGNGKTIDFTNTIIIATSNAGSEVVREYLASGQSNVEELKTNLLNYLQEQGIYRPEFLNRFGGIIVFRPLMQDEIARVAQLMIDGLNKQLEDKGITIQVAPDALDYLVKLGYDPVFGARPMRRVIQEKLENFLAKKMLVEGTERGAVINLTLADLSSGGTGS
ncbi:MAG: ATP-dependent Clp protease ATP-binding subunit [bacterium]|nr:ATP-dependent Clp protease ATP-binding subunit [bacterium]